LRRLRLLANEPMMADVPGVGWKPLRDCSDEEVHAIARYHSQLGTLRLFDEDWFLRHTMEAREEERNPPSESAVAAIITNAPPKWRLALRVLDQTGMRAGELVKLEWGDVDITGSRFRIRVGKTAAAPRWVVVPEWVMEDVLATYPPDDRTSERRVFLGATRQILGMAMRRGCQAAGLALYSPHDLRHRYASVKIREGVPVTELAAQLGHTRKSMTLDTYSHVLLRDGQV
jgi:integrase